MDMKKRRQNKRKCNIMQTKIDKRNKEQFGGNRDYIGSSREPDVY